MELDVELEKFQLKQLLKKLSQARGNGTSMISLIIPKDSQVSQVGTLLTQEYGTANNIKSHINKLSVQAGIKSAQERLKLYSKIPPNGLVIYVGSVLLHNKEKKICLDLQPFRPLNKFIYRCDNKFALEPLEELLQDDDVFGFIIVDGHSCWYVKVRGDNKEVVLKFETDLPRKHSKGGQSSQRFARIRLEKRHNYLRKVAENATSVFITNDRPNVKGLILAGSSLFKKNLAESDLLDARLKPMILSIVDIGYGAEAGLQQAILLSSEILGNTKYVKERQILGQYFDDLNKDQDSVCYGLKDTLYALKAGVVSMLLLWENLDLEYEDETNSAAEKMLLVDYLVQNAKNHGATVQLITDQTPEGSQFVKGFGGLGGFMRYTIKMPDLEYVDDSDDEFI